ncbi:MAG: thermonuclease family protein [Pseudomonadota bacterium]
MFGTSVEGVVHKVTDGDTVQVTAQNQLLKVRVLGLDTEESNPGGNKPVTEWGKEATRFTTALLPQGSPITVEFPGSAPFLIDGNINRSYLDNFGRPLGFLHLDTPQEGTANFSELMIKKGFSPYFVKYGRAQFPEYDALFAAAEIEAQRANIGVWNQKEANGITDEAKAPRNYAQLSVWWELRARIIDIYRDLKSRHPGADLFNTRLDYVELLEKAEKGDSATVFMELRESHVVDGTHRAFRSGSQAQPFQLFLPDAARPEIVEILNLADNRYVANGEGFPRRNYAYISGPLKMFNGLPEMVVENINQIGDMPPAPVLT